MHNRSIFFNEMNFVIAKSPFNLNLLNSQSPRLVRVRFRVPSLLHSSVTKWTRGSKTLRLSFPSPLGRASCASASTIYGGWDDLGVSEFPGEFDALRNFLVSVGIDDRKNIFVFFLGLVCALAISRVKVSSVLVLPGSALVFAAGFTVGFFKNGTFGDVRVNGSNKKREKEENFKLSHEKLRSLVEFFDEFDRVVNNLKSVVQSAIRDKKIRVGEFYGYVEVTDRLRLSGLNARSIVKSLIDSSEEKPSGVLVENHKSSNGRRKKQVGEAGYQVLQSIGSLFGENLQLHSSNSTRVRENVERASDQTRGNGAVPLVEDRALDLVDDRKVNGMLDDSSQGSSINPVLDMDKNGRIGTNPEKENFGLQDNHRSTNSTNKFLDEREYSYRSKGLRFTNNHSFSLKMDSSSITDMWESHDNILGSESFRVRMKQMESESSFLREQLLNQGPETYRSSLDSGFDRSQYKEDGGNYDDHRHLADDVSARENEFNTPSSAKVSDDMMFDRYLAEAMDLLKQAKEFIKDRYGEEQAEIMLYRSADLLSKAVDLKPMSLLAVGQLGNTYLLHGELKLKISRELRTLLSGSIQPSSGKHSRISKELRNKVTSKEEATQLLIDVCEECEELLVEAGRKYRLALSIDANDVRALYNWGLALSFRGQLIADIGPVCIHYLDTSTCLSSSIILLCCCCSVDYMLEFYFLSFVCS